jgi:hypothetical protein
MGWLGKSVGSHIAGAAKYLGKNISNGSSWIGKTNRIIGSVRDRYANAKKSLLTNISNYNPEIGKLAKSGIGILENEVSNQLQPYIDRAKNIAGMGGRALLNFQNE